MLPLDYEVEWTPADGTGPDVSVSVRIINGDELLYISDTTNPVLDDTAVIDVEVDDGIVTGAGVG
jgi:uncharacterized lipoprotein YbaY